MKTFVDNIEYSYKNRLSLKNFEVAYMARHLDVAILFIYLFFAMPDGEMDLNLFEYDEIRSPKFKMKMNLWNIIALHSERLQPVATGVLCIWNITMKSTPKFTGSGEKKV